MYSVLVLPTARLELTKAGNPSEPEPAKAVFRLDVHRWLMSRAAWLRAALNRLSLARLEGSSASSVDVT